MMGELFKNKTILITGGTGFLGRTLIKRLLNEDPHSIRIFSRDEYKHHKIQEIFNNNPKIRNFIGDVRDYERLKRAVKGADIVIHAAALKRIDMIEYNVEEVIKTNILGTLNVIRACLDNDVENAIFISTDKACSPVNTYGACKFVGERIFTESNFNKGSAKTRFVCVRYGNVLESTGSVIPFFIEKIKKRESIPLTDETMTRFAITPDEAVDLIFKAVKYGIGGEVFIPILPSFKIIDLIYILKEHFSANTDIKIIGLRPGEKIHEILVNESEALRTYKFEDLLIVTSQIEKYQDNCYAYLKKNNLIAFKEYSSKDNLFSQIELKKYLMDVGVLKQNE